MVKPTDGGWAVYSHRTRKRISRVYKSKAAALARLREIQHYKHKLKTS